MGMLQPPGVYLHQVDGGMGIIPRQFGNTGAVIGNAGDGEFNRPMVFLDIASVISTFGDGPLVELGCYLLQKTSKAIVLVRTNTTQPGVAGKITTSIMPPAYVSWKTGAAVPKGDYDIIISLSGSGTVGGSPGGISYEFTLNGGDKWSLVTPLETNGEIDLLGDGSLVIVISPGTLILRRETIAASTTGPSESLADLHDASQSLRATKNNWDVAILANTIDSAKFALLDSWMQELWDAQQYKAFMANARDIGATGGETSQAWQRSLIDEYENKTTTFGALVAGHCWAISTVSRQEVRVPAIWGVAAKALGVRNPRIEDLAAIRTGPLPSDCRITDVQNNLIEHDETKYGILDAAGFLTLRTWDDYPGVWVYRPRIKCSPTSDFQWWQHRALVNNVAAVVRRKLTENVRFGVRMDRETGRILESEAANIEAGVNAAVENLVGPQQEVSAHRFVLSRTDDLAHTSPPEITGEQYITPLGFPDKFMIGISMMAQIPT